MKKFSSPKDAESTSEITSGNAIESTASTTDSLVAEPSAVVQVFNQLLIDTQLNVLSKLFSAYASTEMSLFVPDDFIIPAAKAMLQLKSSNRSNEIYNLAKAIGTIREDKSDSR